MNLLIAFGLALLLLFAAGAVHVNSCAWLYKRGVEVSQEGFYKVQLVIGWTALIGGTVGFYYAMPAIRALFEG